MARYVRLGMAAALSACMVAGAANAQALRREEVLGAWMLRITPTQGARVTIRTDNGRVEMPVTIAARGQAGIACLIDGEAADCRLRRGELVMTLNMDTGRMTHTLNARRGDDLTGTTRISAPLMPFGSFNLGTAAMTRR